MTRAAVKNNVVEMHRLTKEIRAAIHTGATRPIVAIFFNHKGEEYRRIRYAFIDTAVPKVSGHALWLTAMHRIELVHIDTGFQIGVLKKNAKGQIQTTFCWDEAPTDVKSLLRSE